MVEAYRIVVSKQHTIMFFAETKDPVTKRPLALLVALQQAKSSGENLILKNIVKTKVRDRQIGRELLNAATDTDYGTSAIKLATSRFI
ncbi:hypothetical protein DD238_006315 [Peronospora effusa]|uniref:Uncharacterized protein n=1 Tax=Peronospora effusa TaxID=542832 RepID=A0A3M6V791_9STRA|nr:hypothetical protein DD238_006315 [Peronospora effusa]RQM14118.1 hypothetical protein DD237_003604 [Peronospora effusa]